MGTARRERRRRTLEGPFVCVRTRGEPAAWEEGQQEHSNNTPTGPTQSWARAGLELEVELEVELG